jgi:hypothetical protein
LKDGDEENEEGRGDQRWIWEKIMVHEINIY